MQFLVNGLIVGNQWFADGDAVGRLDKATWRPEKANSDGSALLAGSFRPHLDPQFDERLLDRQ
jgi:hypothetical protein